MNDNSWTMTVRALETIDAEEVLKASILFHPNQPHELRGLPSGRSRLVRISEPDQLIIAAQDLADDYGIYYTLNPVRPDLGDHAAKASDIIQRWNMLIDIDAIKSDPNVMATKQEKIGPYELMNRVLDFLSEQCWPSPMIIDSGNGTHLIYRIDMPSNDHSRMLIGRVLKTLGSLLHHKKATIDTKVHNASRISRLPGTWARKGIPTDERPHAMARILWAPEVLVPVTVKQLDEEWMWRKRESRSGACIALGNSGLDSPSEPGNPGLDAPSEPDLSNRGDLLWTMETQEASNRVEAYVRSAVERELARVVMAPNGKRNDALNRAAFALGQLVGAGYLGSADTTAKLRDAAIRSGLHADSNCGLQGIARSIESGLTSGMEHPRTIPGWIRLPTDTPEPTDPKKRLIILASEISPRKVEWLWPDRIPLGKLTTFAGWGGLGKSFVTLDLAARISRGGEIPGTNGECFQDGNVLILNSEDDPEDTSVPRLMEAGADLKRIAFARSEILGRFTLADLKILDLMLDQLGGAHIVVLDPATAHLGMVSDNRNAELRGLLAPLSLWAMDRRVAVILVTHVNKAIGKDVEAMCRVVGSVAWVNAVRAAVMFARDPHDRSRRLFIPFKANNAPEVNGLAYRIVPTELLAKVEWLEEVSTSADEAMAQPDTPASTKRNDVAGTFLHAYLAEGEKPGDETVEAGNKAIGQTKGRGWWITVLKRIGGYWRKTDFEGKYIWGLDKPSETTEPIF